MLFAHGYDVTPDFYAPLLERWAAAGYVVAAPVFPILSGSDGGASHVDYEKTFGDASFVITQVLGLRRGDAARRARRPESHRRRRPLRRRGGRRSASGSSRAVATRGSRSVISMAGDLSNANNPHVRDTGTPILHIMETNDEYDPYPHSIEWDRDNLTAPRWMVTPELESRAAVHAARQPRVRAREHDHRRLPRRHPQGAPRAARRR